MIEMKRYHCEECGYFWELSAKHKFPDTCPKCNGHLIHRAVGDRRFSRKARPKVRWSFPVAARR